MRNLPRIVFGACFVAAGVAHFVRTDWFAAIVPPYLPWPVALVYLSGAAEILLGLMLMRRRWARLAAWGLVALLIAVFPANVHMAVNPHRYPATAPAVLSLRLLVQPLLIWWAWRYARVGFSPICRTKR